MNQSSNSSDRFALVIFGITGNLSQIKLIPALYDLAEAGLLPKGMKIIGVGRAKMTNAEFQTFVSDTLAHPNRHHQHPILDQPKNELLSAMHYVDGDFSTPELDASLKKTLSSETACTNRMFYLATYPNLYGDIFTHLETSGLNDQSCGWVRVMVEKPIGIDYESAKSLNQLLRSYYKEEQIFRLDHYLGKETVQNILTFRFGNGMFEPLMTSEYVDHIQVTAAEDFGIGLRGGYYDTVGALKDVGQNHLLQMISVATMEAPGTFSNKDISQKRIDAVHALVPEPGHVVFGQYEGYTSEAHVDPKSTKDTYFAFRTHLSSGRLQDVPIYVRAGKNLSQNVTEIAIVFKVHAPRLFPNHAKGTDPNILIYRIQPNEGIVLKILTKRPGQEHTLEDAYMQFCYKHLGVNLPDPYLRLLLDALSGDQTFFIDAEESELEWKFSDPLSSTAGQPEVYAPGSWGPKSADALIENDGRKWLVPSVMFCSR